MVVTIVSCRYCVIGYKCPRQKLSSLVHQNSIENWLLNKWNSRHIENKLNNEKFHSILNDFSIFIECFVFFIVNFSIVRLNLFNFKCVQNTFDKRISNSHAMLLFNDPIYSIDWKEWNFGIMNIYYFKRIFFVLSIT